MQILNTYYDEDNIYAIIECIESDEDKKKYHFSIDGKEYFIFAKFKIDEEKKFVIGRLREEGKA